MGDNIIMSKKEFQRIDIIHKVLNKRLTKVDASKLLHLCYKQTCRIIKKVQTQGIQSLVHKNRGKASNKKFSNEFLEQILCLHQQIYFDSNPTLFSELLAKNNNISISKESLRSLFLDADIPYKTRKSNSSPCHIWRERKEHFGELIQYERTFPILDFTKRFVQKFGIPHAVYLDKHSTYKTTRQANVDEEIRNCLPETQFQRVMRNIGANVIFANSPQAKGRIERLFQTLQDRLVVELRLAGISNIDQANLFLDSFLDHLNSKFSRQPKNPASFFKPVLANFDYKWSFSIQDKRFISPDFTIRWNKKIFIFSNPSISLKKRRVFIHQALDDSLRFSTKNKILAVKEITQKHIDIAKLNFKSLQKIAKQYHDKKSKKSWMDKFYSSGFKNFYS